MTSHQPSVFVSYRRADEPFAAALTASQIGGFVGDGEVFLDTLYLRQRGSFERELLAAVRGSRLVLAVIGVAWDGPANLARLAEPGDWVRRELEEATAAGIPVVPVLVGRTAVPAVPGLLVAFDTARAVAIDQEDAGRSQVDLGRLLGRAPAIGGSPRKRLERAILALLRHVLPAPQRTMDNDRTVARCVAAQLGERDWLRFVVTGNLPGTPNGSTVGYLTSHRLGIAQLAEDLTCRPQDTLPTGGLMVRRSDRHRLWKPVADLELTAAGRSVDLRGVFAEEADELIELLGGRTSAPGEQY